MTSLSERRLGGKKLFVLAKRDGQGNVQKGTIQLLEDGAFQEKYAIHDKVMDSTHRHMEIRYGTRKSDNFKVVIKLRYKPGCFSNKKDERDWRVSTEFMLSLPACEGVAELYEVCEDSKAFYIVTELASGCDLFELIHQKPRKELSAEAVKGIMKPILEAIAHMHENNAVHKDLKLENIVVDANAGKVQYPGWSPKSVKIIDFDTVEEWSPRTPKSKDVLGTDQYIAQEAYDGTYSPCSDIFSLGVVFYKLSTGKFPFREQMFDDKPGENWVGSPAMKQIRNRLKMFKVEYTQQCFVENPALAELCARMLAYDVGVRPSAQDALQSEFFGGPGLPGVSSAMLPIMENEPKNDSPKTPKAPQFGAQLSTKSITSGLAQFGAQLSSRSMEPKSPGIFGSLMKKASSIGSNMSGLTNNGVKPFEGA